MADEIGQAKILIRDIPDKGVEKWIPIFYKGMFSSKFKSGQILFKFEFLSDKKAVDTGIIIEDINEEQKVIEAPE